MPVAEKKVLNISLPISMQTNTIHVHVSRYNELVLLASGIRDNVFTNKLLKLIN